MAEHLVCLTFDFEHERGVLTVTFHPYIIGRGHRLLALESFVDTLAERGAAFVAAGDAVARLI
jgi:hypothetical protein